MEQQSVNAAIAAHAVLICDCDHLLGRHPFDGQLEPCIDCECRHFHWSLRTVKTSVPRCANPQSRRKKLPFRAVWDRDDWTCIECGTHKYLTVDHIIPLSKGGTDDLDNLQTMCKSCNSRKGNRV